MSEAPLFRWLSLVLTLVVCESLACQARTTPGSDVQAQPVAPVLERDAAQSEDPPSVAPKP